MAFKLSKNGKIIADEDDQLDLLKRFHQKQMEELAELLAPLKYDGDVEAIMAKAKEWEEARSDNQLWTKEEVAGTDSQLRSVLKSWGDAFRSDWPLLDHVAKKRVPQAKPIFFQMAAVRKAEKAIEASEDREGEGEGEDGGEGEGEGEEGESEA